MQSTGNYQSLHNIPGKHSEPPCKMQGADEKRILNFSQKPEGKRPLHLATDDDIKMNLKEIVHEGVDWIHLAEDRVQWKALMIIAMNLRVP
jgi:hypothetical protein